MKKNFWNALKENLGEGFVEIVFTLLFFAIGFGVCALFAGTEWAWEADGELLVALGAVLFFVALGVPIFLLVRIRRAHLRRADLKGKDGLRLSTMKREEFDRFYAALTEAFVREERRDYSDALATLASKDFLICKIYVGERHVGYVTLWFVADFVFIEHFFILDVYRGCGYGGRVLELLEKQFGAIVLEAEPPEQSEIAARRVAFYERWGFFVNSKAYAQPSYHGEEPVPLVLMSYHAALEDFDDAVDEIYKKVYGIKKKRRSPNK